MHNMPVYLPLAPSYNHKYTCKNEGVQPANIAKRNARERNRVKQVNDGYNALRKKLPASVISALSQGSRRGSGKKLSKVDTLRMVVEYIRYLERMVGETGAETQEYSNADYGSSSPYSDMASSPSSECSVSSYKDSYNMEQDSYSDELLGGFMW